MAMSEAQVRMIFNDMSLEMRMALRGEVDGVKTTIDALLAGEKVEIDKRNIVMQNQVLEMQQRQEAMTQFVEQKERELNERKTNLDDVQKKVSDQFDSVREISTKMKELEDRLTSWARGKEDEFANMKSSSEGTVAATVDSVKVRIDGFVEPRGRLSIPATRIWPHVPPWHPQPGRA